MTDNTFTRVDLSTFVHGNIILGTGTERKFVRALRAAYAEIDRLEECLDIATKTIGQLGDDVEFWKQEQVKACVEANGLAIECEQLEADVARLRASVLEWVTVTGDPATLPDIGRLMVLMCQKRSSITKTEISAHEAREWLEPGDRWAYIPEVQP